MKHFDCKACRNQKHNFCENSDRSCACSRTDHEYPIYAPTRLMEGIEVTLKDRESSPHDRANTAVLMILSTMAVDSKSPMTDIPGVALALQERTWGEA